MKILYRQPENGSLLEQIGVQNCYFKYLSGARDGKSASRREHYHTTFEIHYIENGFQRYRIGEESYTAQKEEFLLIPPGIQHTLIDSAPHMYKIGVTFSSLPSSPFFSISRAIHMHADERIPAAIAAILSESRMKSAFSAQLVEGRIFEALILILRLCGYRDSAHVAGEESEDLRLILARQFIQDNVELNIKVSDVADYCHLSTKQLNRIFQSNDMLAPAAYIQAQRIHQIEHLLEKTDLPLKSISEKMHFANEYHFNSFFRKYAGMPPGEYRKMNQQHSAT